MIRNNTATRVRWLLADIEAMVRNLRPPAGQSYPVRREFGWGWTVRSNHGWRRFPLVTPPLHSTRRIAADEESAALDWGMERVGIA